MGLRGGGGGGYTDPRKCSVTLFPKIGIILGEPPDSQTRTGAGGWIRRDRWEEDSVLKKSNSTRSGVIRNEKAQERPGGETRSATF